MSVLHNYEKKFGCRKKSNPKRELFHKIKINWTREKIYFARLLKNVFKLSTKEFSSIYFLGGNWHSFRREERTDNDLNSGNTQFKALHIRPNEKFIFVKCFFN